MPSYKIIGEKTMIRHDDTKKITPGHLARKAVVYLRQSSVAQIKQNQDSQCLQYALTDTDNTYGFKRVLASVAMGEVGMVLSRELSRLSRIDKDWCQLMKLCQIFDTLVADAEKLYDLNRLDDQL
jgi:DNA invertase Pin-like site-specific DNA recombinase